MKKIILSAMLMAFALAVNAADDKACADKEKSGGCCSKAVAEAKGSCPAGKEGNATCPYAKAAKETASKPVASPKGSEQVKKS